MIRPVFRRPVGLTIVLCCGGLTAGAAQKVVIRLDAVGLTYQEINAAQGQAVGGGIGYGAELNLGRVRLDFRGYRAQVTPPEGARIDFRFVQLDARLGYFFTEFLALEIGGGRRNASPEFAAPDVGVVRVGVLSENELHRQAKVWVRGAYVGDPRFNTGGSSTMAFEFSLGVAFATSTGRFRVHAEYEFQRIDRVVQNADVPMQLSLVRTGIGIGF